ncbi:hypothetical protein [Pseudomonas qingdaonensis]|uniref:hypothetical protein n=1 Tax=Pseudomonas qingdaonensis TaxID=2056231 RepID=UPI00333EF184
MSVYPFKYKVLNRETGRKVSVTRWRVQIRKGGENINKVFDDETVAVLPNGTILHTPIHSFLHTDTLV